MSSNSPIRKALSRPAFLIVAVILLLAAVTLNTATQALRLYFKKEAVPQPRDFREMPLVMGNWMQVSEDEKLDKEIQDVLGTDKYVFRDYIDVDLRGADLLALIMQQSHPSADKTGASPELDQQIAEMRSEFNGASFDRRVAMIRDALNGKTPQERKKLVLAMQMRYTTGVVNMGVTYYTGLVDTVAHIPDRCYIADGYEPSSYEIPIWDMAPEGSGQSQPLQVRFISFEDQTGAGLAPKCVAYVFQVNGKYQSDPLAVRQELQSLTQRYGYYAKIELMTIGNDTKVASESMCRLLSVAKPQIEKCLPDWAKVIKAHS
ncbi:MAG: hypothetical protein ABR964_11020 [Tepidisphaeraceae bacterium]|jgi:hypothetical protein